MDELEKKLNEYINGYSYRSNSDLDFAIGQLHTAIGSLERVLTKRKEKEAKQLIDNFKNAYNALVKANITVSVEIGPDNDVYHEFGRREVDVEIDDVEKFIFD